MNKLDKLIKTYLNTNIYSESMSSQYSKTLRQPFIENINLFNYFTKRILNKNHLLNFNNIKYNINNLYDIQASAFLLSFDSYITFKHVQTNFNISFEDLYEEILDVNLRNSFMVISNGITRWPHSTSRNGIYFSKSLCTNKLESTIAELIHIFRNDLRTKQKLLKNTTTEQEYSIVYSTIYSLIRIYDNEIKFTNPQEFKDNIKYLTNDDSFILDNLEEKINFNDIGNINLENILSLYDIHINELYQTYLNSYQKGTLIV